MTREAPMLSYEDCVAFCALSEDEITAIAEHEGIPELAAAELGSALLQRPDGVARIRAMIADDIATAQRRRNFIRSTELKSVLRQFVATHASGAGAKDRT
jgi:hypothetical protein